MKRQHIVLCLLALTLGMAWTTVQAQKKAKRTAKAATEVAAPDTTATQPVDTIALLEQRAGQADTEACYALGMAYYEGTSGASQDLDKAARWFAVAADKGHARATTMLAVCYQQGKGVAQDLERAAGLYVAASRRGDSTVVGRFIPLADQQSDVLACRVLAECYISGAGVAVDKTKAQAYAEKAARAGDQKSRMTVALTHYNNGRRSEAFPYFEQAALAGNVQAAYFYGLMLYDGDGTGQDRPKGLNYLQRAADAGHAAACAKLGEIYLNGDGMTQDPGKGFDMTRRAAEKGNGRAQWTLANCYRQGTGVKQDYYLAAQWMSQVATTRHNDYKALIEQLKAKNDPFYSYLKGLNCYYLQRDFEAAEKLFKAVDKARVAEGKTMQGVCLASKQNPKSEPAKGAKLLEKASKDSPAACYYLSLMLETGTGVKQDAQRALQLLTLAADSGNEYAQCRLADKYIMGDGIGMDMARAAHYYLLAEAQHGLTPEAARHLADLYENAFPGLPAVDDLKAHILKLRNTKENKTLLNMLTNTKF